MDNEESTMGLLCQRYWLKWEQSVVDGQSFCQSHCSFVPEPAAAKSADKKKNQFEHFRASEVDPIIILDQQYVCQSVEENLSVALCEPKNGS